MRTALYRMVLLFVCPTAASTAADVYLPESPSTEEVVRAVDLLGGLVVHVGCGDGKLTASLPTSENVVVQGLDRSAAAVDAARRHIQSKRLYGRVSVRRWQGGSLPYNDNLVNLLVMQDAGYEIRDEEIMRVLAPGGVALELDPDTRNQKPETHLRKPRSAELDDWTHSLYDASGNAVSHDRGVAPSKHLQWFTGPRFGRQHEHMSSFSAMVSEAGRIFFIVDEGSPVSIMLPSDWKLIARDAYNGGLLWKRPIARWQSRYWPMKNGPVVLPRRLVAAGGEVFVTLGIDAPIVALDASSGRTLRTFDQTRGTFEFVVCDGGVFAVVTPDGRLMNYRREIEDMVAQRNKIFGQSFPNDVRDVVAVDAKTGKTLWKIQSQTAQSSLSADARHVAFHDNEGVVCLDRATGRQRWKTPVEQSPKYQFGRGATLVLADDVVLFSGMAKNVTALAADSGEILWAAPHTTTGHHSPYDVFVIDGQVWFGQTASGRKPGTFVGLDLQSGEVIKTFTMAKEPYWFHHRCHRARATDNYLITSRTGTEFIDFRNGRYDVNHWVRGACTYGIMPANGLLYAPTHPCACYLSTKLSYFNVLAPSSRVTYDEQPRTRDQRLIHGPAYLATSKSDLQPPTSNLQPTNDWPFYRHDMSRSGATPAKVGTNLTQRWATSIGGELTSCIVADGKVFVAAKDAHTLHAFDAQTGRPSWQFTVDGRIDSPPAYIDGLLIFGSADGSVYCLTAAEGKLVWRYDAAPQRRQMVALGQLESSWPVHGSVFLQDNTVYCIAGRSRFLDGGMRLVMLDVRSGRLLGETLLDEHDMATGEDLHKGVRGLSMPTGLTDILSGNGKYIFMHDQVFDLKGNTLAADPLEAEEIAHLFTPTGFLDDSWFHRTYWLWGSRFHSGWNQWYKAGRAVPAGRILAHRGSSVFGFGRVQGDYRWITPLKYHLFRIDKTPAMLDPTKRNKEAGYGQPTRNKFKYDWTHDVPIFVKAMVLADETLFVAGPPSIFDEKEEWKQVYEPAAQAKFARQAEMLQGSRGSLLWAVSAASGEKLYEHALQSIPVWDGMAAAYGCLYLPMENGTLVCVGGR